MLERGIVESSNNLWASPILLGPKKKTELVFTTSEGGVLLERSCYGKRECWNDHSTQVLLTTVFYQNRINFAL